MNWTHNTNMSLRETELNNLIETGPHMTKMKRWKYQIIKFIYRQLGSLILFSILFLDIEWSCLRNKLSSSSVENLHVIMLWDFCNLSLKRKYLPVNQMTGKNTAYTQSTTYLLLILASQRSKTKSILLNNKHKFIYAISLFQFEFVCGA